MARETVAVHGLKEFLKACTQAEPQRPERSPGNVPGGRRHHQTRRHPTVLTDQRASAGGFRTRVRQKGIAVQQSKRKTTGKHPEYGSLQMRAALLPALMSNETDMNRQLERALDRVGKRFERRP